MRRKAFGVYSDNLATVLYSLNKRIKGCEPVMRRRFSVILITTTILVTIIVVYFIRSAEPPDEASPLISIDLESSVPLRGGNITQGMAFTVNLTISSAADKELTVPLGLSLTGLENVGWLPPLAEKEVFSSAFEPNPLILQPHGSSSSLLAVNLAEDAPLGAYVFYVELGNQQETGVEGTSFIVDVNPK